MRDCYVCGQEYEGGRNYCGATDCLSEIRRRARARGNGRGPATQVRYVEVAGIPYLLGPANVARYLTEAGFPCDGDQVDAWRSRRLTSGFPTALDVVVNGVPRQAYDPDEMLAWRRSYVPSRGGAPRGERNGAHRRYATRVSA